VSVPFQFPSSGFGIEIDHLIGDKKDILEALKVFAGIKRLANDLWEYSGWDK
jgi:hypothetical protein